jgi:hypothetical protein
LQRLNLTAPQPLHHVHVTTPFRHDDDVGVQSGAKVAEYYSQLTKRQVRDLYHMYRPDHQLFGYSPEKYIALARD